MFLLDLRTIINQDDLLKTEAYHIFRTYNVEQLISVDSHSKDNKVILCKYAEVSESDSLFIDPFTNEIMVVDHVKGVSCKIMAIDIFKP